jgi:hypothetical protein
VRPRLIYRVHRSRARGKDRRKGFTETDYARLLDAEHQQLGGPLVVVWDNLNTHVSAAMTELIAARDWLKVFWASSRAMGDRRVGGWGGRVTAVPPRPVLVAEVPEALLERCAPGSDPLRCPGPFAYQTADLAHEGRDAVALSADLGVGGVHGRPGRHAG